MRTTIVALTLLVGITAQSYASTTYSLASGQQDAGNHPVSANVVLSLSQVGSTEVLTVVVDNYTANQISDGENITGVELNINSSQITGGSLAASSGALIGVPSKSAVTSLGTGSLANWTAATSLSELLVTTIGSGQPTYGIIGAPGTGSVYSNANGSLTGSAKQPYAQQTATFTIDLTGIDITLASITGAEIGFGTQGTNYINASVVSTLNTNSLATPEPGTFWMFGISGALIGLGTLRKRFSAHRAVSQRNNVSRGR